jgi:omega-3 fatty acid desaturase (delta-15 desaturase)
MKKCLLSASVVAAFASAFWFLSGRNLATLGLFYLGPYVIFGWWLVTVTFLQHHGPNTVHYNDKYWNFVDAVFQTIDRTYGFGIDTLSHHITDGHVVHHLFFTKIPHYNLPMATKALKKHLDKNDLGWLYQKENTFDFATRIHTYLLKTDFITESATSSPHRS